MRSEIKGVVTITEGPVQESQAFTMNELGATGGFGILLVSGEWLARAEARQQIRINSHLVYAPGTHAWMALNKQKAFISSVYGIVDCEHRR